MTISGLVPPDGLDCRQIWQICTCVAWILSAGLDGFFNYKVPLTDKQPRPLLFYLTFTKDIVVTIAILSWVIVINVGYLNRCACFTMWGKAALALPEMPQVADKLSHRIDTIYPGIAFTSISLELIVIPLIIGFHYSGALRVFMQRDDGVSNAGWLRKLWCRFSDTVWPWGLKRRDTEEGRELQPTTAPANGASSDSRKLAEGVAGLRSHFA